jgi:hypothetical protein
MNNQNYVLEFLNKFNKGGKVRHFYEGGEIDFGDMDFGDMDFGDMDFGDIDLGGLDLGDVDLGSLDLGDIDLGNVDIGDIDLGNVDLGDIDLGDIDLGGTNIGDIDLGSTDLGDTLTGGNNIGDIDLGGSSTVDLNELVGGDSSDATDVLSGGAGMDDDYEQDLSQALSTSGALGLKDEDLDSLVSNEDAESNTSYGTQGDADNSSLASGDATAAKDSDDLANTDWKSLYNEGLTEEQVKDREDLEKYTGDRVQNFGASTDVDKSLSDMGDRGTKLTSDWQKTKDGRYVKVNDDGSGIGIDQDGNSFALSTSQVGSLIKSGDLNTFKSGYNTVTGGNTTAPGGGSQVTLKNGKTGTLTTDGDVINNDTGDKIGTEKDVKTVITQDGDGNKIELDKTTGTAVKPGGGGGTTAKTGEKSDNSLLMFLLMMMMMNQNKGGGGGSSAVIPGLTATQKQTPYSQQQAAAGYRPGQGGISYFQPTQYAPKMASGGIARLLKGPGDGVSDSIPAVIDGGMAGGGQPAKVARGEYIIDARTVAALGNGSTDAGAERLDKMRRNILRDDRKAGVGKDSKAYRHLLA